MQPPAPGTHEDWDELPWSAACPCGWTGGTYPGQEAAIEAVHAHRAGECPGRAITGEVMF